MAGVQHRSLEIDNVWGSIEVVGTISDQLQLTVKKSVRAESKDKLEQARKEVTLDIAEQAGSLKLYVNGPFRCNCNDGCGHRELDRKSTRLNSSHTVISYAVFCLKKKTKTRK